MRTPVTLVFASLGVVAPAAHAQRAVDTIEVIGAAPLGEAVDADKVASYVQTATAEQLRNQRALDLADFMKRSLSGVFVNDAQSNPLQPDVQYRGFVGSPLLGLPQGIAVYQDGVRVNEPFGDTVNWALIPESAIDTVYVMPGSNPLFGLNALGGAISIKTKDGFDHSGSSAEFYGGSFSRVGLEAETGGTAGDRFSYFVTGSYFDEDGWRNFSPTNAKQLFGDVTWRLDGTRVDANLTLVNTDLVGNGAAPADLLELDRRAIFTRPDRTQNDLALLNVAAKRDVSRTLALTGNVYVRNSDVKTHNGDDSDFEECADDPGFLCSEDESGGGEEVVRDADGRPVRAAEDVEGATVNRTSTTQDGRGFDFQSTWSGDLGRRENQLVVGLAYDETRIGFAADTELGALDETRLAVPSGVFVGDSFTRMHARMSSSGLYVSDTLSLSERFALTLSGRYNRSRIELRDEIGSALDGDHTFRRFNPAVSLTAALSPRLAFYAGYSESSRTPSPVELTCADEDDPCRLPNAFLSDPPLEQVVAKTIEAGVRGKWTGGGWHAGAFRTLNQNDITFISAGALTNEGFFSNVGRTRREGIELNLDGGVGSGISWFANYTYLRATFGEDFFVASPNNPAAVDGRIFVRAGDRLPLIPAELLKAGVRFPVGSRTTLGANLLASSSFYLRGDEGNDTRPVAGYGVLDFRADYRITDKVRLFLNVDNVFDRDYATFGTFGNAENVLGPEFDGRRFLSPGAPRAAWLGIDLKF